MTVYSNQIIFSDKSRSDVKQPVETQTMEIKESKHETEIKINPITCDPPVQESKQEVEIKIDPPVQEEVPDGGIKIGNLVAVPVFRKGWVKILEHNFILFEITPGTFRVAGKMDENGLAVNLNKDDIPKVKELGFPVPTDYI